MNITNAELAAYWPNKHKAGIVFLQHDGCQKFGLLEQLPEYANESIIINRASEISTYEIIALRFVPLTRFNTGSRNGLVSNSVEKTFINCNYLGLNDIRLLRNGGPTPNNLDPKFLGNAFDFADMMYTTVITLPTEEYLTTDFFLDIALLFGGCGSGAFTGDQETKVAGAAVAFYTA